MTQIFLVRHGQSEGNLFRRVQGQTDVNLTADGKAQLPYLAKRFAETPLAAVYTSPLRRAEETAAAIVGGRDIPFLWTSGSLKCASARGKCGPGAR